MSRSAIISAIKTLLEAVTDIGQVYDSIRWTIYEDKFIQDFFTVVNGQNQIRTWMIYKTGGGQDYGARSGSLGTGVDIPTQSALDRHDITIEGWASFTDNDSDSDFQALVDSVLDKFRAEISLTDTALVRGPINYAIDHQFFGQYFVHHVILNFYAVERTGITPV
jgi:hypothetical protein|tara:strand:- start:827 stop:1321 length:495 start_codon:yes stop_codon:yes gene_type:complete